MLNSSSKSSDEYSEIQSDASDSTVEVILEKRLNRGKRKKRFQNLHKKQIAKKRKDSGKSYTNSVGKKV